MKNLKFTVLAVIFSAVCLVFPSELQKAKAGAAGNENYKCAILPLKQALQSSKAVFLGKVVGEGKSGDLRTFEFEVE